MFRSSGVTRRAYWGLVGLAVVLTVGIVTRNDVATCIVGLVVGCLLVWQAIADPTRTRR